MAANVEVEVGRDVEAASTEAALDLTGSKAADLQDAVSKGDGSQDAGLADDGSKEGGSTEAGSDVAAAKEGGSKDAGLDDEVFKEGVSKDSALCDDPSKEAGSDDAGAKEGGSKDAGLEDDVSKEAGSNAGAEEGEAREEVLHGSEAQELGLNEGASKETDKPEEHTAHEECSEGPSTQKRSHEQEPQELADTESKKRFYTCKCFYSKNIFLPEYELFVTYTTKSVFWRQYSTYLVSKGCDSEKFTKLVKNIEDEIKRRKDLGEHFVDSRRTIQQLYKPLHPHVYKLQPSFLTQEFRDLVAYCKSQEACFDGILQRVKEVEAERVYVFSMFTEDFCRDFLEELQHFESSDMPKSRPNSMNHYGVNLDELGCDEGLISPLREGFLRPLTAMLYPDKGGGSLDSHKAFIVKYTSEREPGLALHFDNAEVTLNVCLGKDFTGGNLYLVDMREEQRGESVEVAHGRGYGILHRGQQMHGARPITAGERLNLIVWMRCSCLRNKKCPMCNELPILQETDGFGDGFTKDPLQMNICSLT